MAYDVSTTNNNGSTNNGSYARRNINTNSIALFNKNKMLSISFYNDYISIAFADMMIGEDGSRHFTPKDKRVSKLMSREQCMALLNAIDYGIYPKIIEYTDNGESGNLSATATVNFNRGVVITKSNGAPSIIDINIERAEGQDKAICQLRAHFDIGSDKIPTESQVYTFGTTTVVENYNPTTGECQVCEVESQFLLFKHLLEQFVDAGSNAVAHSINQSTVGWKIGEIYSTLNAVAEKNGIHSSYNKKTNGSYNSYNPFGGGTADATDEPAQDALKMQEAPSIDAMLSGGDIPF